MDQQAAPGGAGSFLAWRRRHGLPPGTPCANCDTVLLGPWCNACGQAAHDTHRHAHHLIAESFESFFHADGRLWRTLLGLITHPAKLTRDFLAGKRASQIPPMRLFLVAILVFFLAGSLTHGGRGVFDLSPLSESDRAELVKSSFNFGDVPAWIRPEANWLQPRIGLAIQHPDILAQVMSEHAHDFAFLMLPVSAFILAAIFLFNRRFVLFDHFIFSMHSLAFQGFLISFVTVMDRTVSGGFGWLMWCAPVHLFVHMRGVYATGTVGTLLRMAVLFVASGIGFALLLAGLLLIGLEALHA